MEPEPAVELQLNLRPVLLMVQKLQRLLSLLAAAGGIQLLLSGVRIGSEVRQLGGALIVTLGLALSMTASLWDREGHLAQWRRATRKDDRLVQLLAWTIKDVQSYILAVGAVGAFSTAGPRPASRGVYSGFCRADWSEPWPAG